MASKSAASLRPDGLLVVRPRAASRKKNEGEGTLVTDYALVTYCVLVTCYSSSHWQNSGSEKRWIWGSSAAISWSWGVPYPQVA